MTQHEVDKLLKDPHIALLVRQIEGLMVEHQRLVSEGKVPACVLMGLKDEWRD